MDITQVSVGMQLITNGIIMMMTTFEKSLRKKLWVTLLIFYSMNGYDICYSNYQYLIHHHSLFLDVFLGAYLGFTYSGFFAPRIMWLSRIIPAAIAT